MNNEIRLDHNITSSNKHGKSAKDNRITDLVKNWTWQKTASGSNVQSMKSTCYRNLNGKTRHGSILLNSYDKSPLLTISQKETEDMMASM